MKGAFLRSGAALFEEVVESLQAGAHLAQQHQQQAMDAAADSSLSVFLASKQHTAQELNRCALAGDELRSELAGIKVTYYTALCHKCCDSWQLVRNNVIKKSSRGV